MNRDDVKKLAAQTSRKARLLASAGKVAAVATPAEPARPAPARPQTAALRVIEGDRVREVAPTPKNAPAAKSGRLRITDETVLRARSRGQQPVAVDPSPFTTYQPAPGVLPKGRKIAQDSSLPGVTWASGAYMEGAWFEGMEFMGYPYLSGLMQRTEYRRAAERLATEMTRKWIKLVSTGDEDKTEKIKQLDDYLKELKLQECAQKVALLDNAFGRAHLYIDTGDTDDLQELKKPIGDGRNKISQRKIGKGSLQRLKVVEPTWCYPARYNATNPLRPDWFKPETWFCMGNEVHHSRLLPFVGREIPDLLKPAYGFGGLSLTQMLKPYVDNWLDTRQSIARLISRFSTSGIKTDMQAQLSPDPGGGGSSSEDFFKRMDLFVTMARNEGLMVIDKNGEEFFQHNVPLGTLDQLQAQSQEQLCSASGIPVVVLLGLTPHGLNASSEGEIRAFEDWVAAYQKHFYGDKLQRVIDFAMISLWGAVDPDIRYEWVPLHTLDEKGIADVQKTKADTDAIYLDRGTLDPLEVRRKIAADPDSGYNGIDVEDVPEPPDDGEGEGGEGDDLFDGEAGNDNDDAEGKNSKLSKFAGDAGEGVPGLPFASDAAHWAENDHPRDKSGQFTSGGSGNIGAPLDASKLKRVGKQMGSNPGGVFEDGQGQRFYVKQGQSRDHVRNEMLAARLYGMAGSPTLKYRPVEGGKHIATEMAKLDKDRAHKLSPAELKKAREEMAIHAWLSNYDAVGTGGDNLGTVKGVPTSLDLGGALTFRAQGAPKSWLNEKADELNTLRDPKINPYGAQVFGKASKEEIATGAKRIAGIPDDDIRSVVEEHGGTPALADLIIARKHDVLKRTGVAHAHDAMPEEIARQITWAMDDAQWEESKHPRNKSGEFAPKGAGESTGGGEVDPSKFKSKKDLISHLLTKGTTAQEVLKHTGWPSVSMPQQALAAGMKLEKYTEGGTTKYKGVPLTDAEKAELKKQLQEKKTAKAKIDQAKQEQAAAPPKQAPAAAPQPAATPKLSYPTPTAQELAQAKKSVALKPQYVPGYNDLSTASMKGKVDALVDIFNHKYSGKSLTNPGDLAEKVANFKNLVASVNDLKQQEAAKKAEIVAAEKKAAAEKAAKLKAEQEKAAKEAAEKNKALMKDLGITEQQAAGFLELAKMLGAKSEDLAQKFKHYEAEAKQYGYPITGFQSALIKNYSDGGYTQINAALRSGSWTPEQHVYASMVNKAIMRMPPHKGLCYRGTSLSPSDLARYKEGHIVEERAFMSTAANPNSAFGGNVRFTVTAMGKRGTHIKKLSNHKGEDEVLFAARTFFKVTKVEKKGDVTHIHMEEWLDE